MKALHYSTKAKKDLKRYRNDIRKMRMLYEVLDMLVNDIKLPPVYRAHMLAGDYKDCMECHIEGDFLLVWMDKDNDIVEILRIGSHSELF
ncbi:type II toxin-antitoxin system YafQ family toxin [Phocaeicola sp.]